MATKRKGRVKPSTKPACSVELLEALEQAGLPLDIDGVLWRLDESADEMTDEDEADHFRSLLSTLRRVIEANDLDTTVAATFAMTMWMVGGLSKRRQVEPAVQARQLKAFGAHINYLREASRLRRANPGISTRECAKQVRRALIAAKGLVDSKTKILGQRRIEQIIALPEEMRAKY